MNSIRNQGLGLSSDPAVQLAQGEQGIDGATNRRNISDNAIIRCTPGSIIYG